MKRYFLYLVVILNPYEGLDYDAINTYDFTQECEWHCIEVVNPEPDKYVPPKKQTLEIDIDTFLEIMEL